MEGLYGNEEQLIGLLKRNPHDSSRVVREILYQYTNTPRCAKVVVAIVNRLLANSKTRAIGFQLLQALLSQYSSDEFTNNILQWSSYCMVHHNNDSTKELKLKTLTLLIQHGDNAEFNKKFSAEYLTSTLKTCLIARNDEERVTGLKCFTQCMKRYPSWFGNHKEKVEHYLITCLGFPCGVVAETSAIALTSLLETGAGGVGGQNYASNFRICFKKICATICALYDNFLDHFSTISDSSKMGEDMFPLVPSRDRYDAHEFENAVGTRIINCLILVKTLLVKPFSVEKQIFPKHIVDVIQKGLSAYLCFSEEEMGSNNNRALLLKRVQLRLFDLFRTLMNGYHTSLIPFSVIFENILLRIFQRVANCNCFVHDMRYKTSVYKTLVYWLSFNKVINEVQFQEKILPIILEDIGASQKTVVLSVNLPDRKKNLRSAQNIDFSGRMLENDVLIERKCIYALDALKHLLSTSLAIDQVRLKEILFLITQKLCDAQMQQTHSIPYNRPTCQVKLLEVFISFIKREDMCILPSLHLTANILKFSINSRDPRISQTSRDGLDLLEKICHSVCPTLSFGDSTPTFAIERNISVASQEERNSPAEFPDDCEVPSAIVKNISENASQEAKNVHAEVADLATSPEDKEVSAAFSDQESSIINVDEDMPENSSREEAGPSRAATETIVLDDGDFENMFCDFEDVVQE